MPRPYIAASADQSGSSGDDWRDRSQDFDDDGCESQSESFFDFSVCQILPSQRHVSSLYQSAKLPPL